MPLASRPTVGDAPPLIDPAVNPQKWAVTRDRKDRPAAWGINAPPPLARRIVDQLPIQPMFMCLPLSSPAFDEVQVTAMMSARANDAIIGMDRGIGCCGPRGGRGVSPGGRNFPAASPNRRHTLTYARTAGDSLSTPTDEQLLAEHLAGEPDRFAILVRRHADELFRFLVRFTSNAAAAEDLVQEVFLQVYQSAGSFDTARRFKPWLFTIAANKARDLLRSRRRRPEMPLDAVLNAEDGAGRTFLDFLADDAPSPPAATGLEEQRERVRQVLEKMPDRLREALVLSYYHGFPYKEIADILGVPLGTVKSRLHAAIAHFGRAYRATVREQV